jgi:hypothetical protein
MKNLRFRLTLLGGAFLMLAFTSVASALASRTWVSGVGDDANPCSRSMPCKSFAGAISKTDVGGEIDCLDPGGFGTLTITKSLTIDCDSGASGTLVSSGNGINIDIATTTGADTVILRNLTITGLTTGSNGISATSAKVLYLEDVVINGFATNCLTANNSAAIQVFVTDSKFLACATGIKAGQNAKVTVVNTFIGNMVGSGISQSSTGSQVFITGSAIASTATALQSSAGNFIGASGNTFSNNGVIYDQNGGQIFTGTDNPSFGNGSTGATTGAVTKT